MTDRIAQNFLHTWPPLTLCVLLLSCPAQEEEFCFFSLPRKPMSHLGSSEPPKAAQWEPSLGSHPWRLHLPSNCPMGSSVFVPGTPIQNQFCCVIF